MSIFRIHKNGRTKRQLQFADDINARIREESSGIRSINNADIEDAFRIN